MSTKTCQWCRKEPAIKRVITDNGKALRWKCKTCLEQKKMTGFAKARPNAS
jgi:hypothetical protein